MMNQQISVSAGVPKRIPHPKRISKDEQKIIFNYRFEEAIGYGTWGKVKKGWDLGAERRIAIKILQKKRISRKIKDGINKIYQEYALLRGLDHESVVKYYDLIETEYESMLTDCKERADCCTNSTSSTSTTASTTTQSTTSSAPSSPSSSLKSYNSFGVKDGKIYLIMEWLGDGCNLTRWIQQRQQQPNHKDQIPQIRLILKKLLSGLEYLRSHGITHHDIKLDNVIYDEGSESVKIIDFGVAELTGTGVESDQSFSAFGTPAYQAPEVLTRTDLSKPISGHKSDIWSLGVVAYQLAHETGELPFEATSIHQIFDKIITEKPDLTVIIPDPQLRDLISKLLCKNPKKRPTASEALTHPFFTAPNSASDSSFSFPSCLRSIFKYLFK